MQNIILAIIKILDNIIMTLKSIAQYKNQKILSSFLVIVSQLMFYIIIKQVMLDDSIITILVVSIASGVGNYIAKNLMEIVYNVCNIRALYFIGYIKPDDGTDEMKKVQKNLFYHFHQLELCHKLLSL